MGYKTLGEYEVTICHLTCTDLHSAVATLLCYYTIFYISAQYSSNTYVCAVNLAEWLGHVQRYFDIKYVQN